MTDYFSKIWPVAAVAAGVLFLISCGAPKSETSRVDGDDRPSHPPVLDAISLEESEGGVMIQVGKSEPFTGVDIEAIEESHDGGETKHFIVETPYSSGKVDGVRRTYFSSGATREEREYRKGEPVQVTTYYSTGGKKFSGPLNSADLVEGATQRWSKEGVVVAEGSCDAEERHQGVWKEYNEQGDLIGQYLWEHGKIKKIFVETPEQVERRMLHYGEVEESARQDAAGDQS